MIIKKKEKIRTLQAQKKKSEPCCSKCIRENRPNRRSCVCQVPSTFRRTSLGKEGCVTCGCIGCHPDEGKSDASSRHESDRHKEDSEEKLKNGCCKKCMKAFSESRRACICQVPFNVRKGTLPDDGCKLCGCNGCHPEELLYKKSGHFSREFERRNERRRDYDKHRDDRHRDDRHRDSRRERSRSRERNYKRRSRSRSKSRERDSHKRHHR